MTREEMLIVSKEDLLVLDYDLFQLNMEKKEKII